MLMVAAVFCWLKMLLNCFVNGLLTVRSVVGLPFRTAAVSLEGFLFLDCGFSQFLELRMCFKRARGKPRKHPTDTTHTQLEKGKRF